MAAKILVKRGPDAEREFILGGLEVQIGRAPSSQIKLTDPGMQGSLKVEFRNGAYQVVNEMPNAIYLNKASLGRGERRTWFHGHTLQPTHDTILELIIDDAAAPAEAGRSAAYEVTAKRGSSTAKKVVQVSIIVVLFGIAGLIFFLPEGKDSTPTLTRTQQQAELEKLREQLSELQLGEQKNRVGLILNRLAEARQNELREHLPEAYEGYARVRDELDSLARSPALPADAPAILEKVQKFVNGRLIDLGRNPNLVKKL
jgi:hypothetical protein